MPEEMEGNVLFLNAASEVMKRYTEQNQAYLENLLAEESGKQIRMKVQLSQGNTEKKSVPQSKKAMDETIGKLNELVGADKLTISD